MENKIPTAEEFIQELQTEQGEQEYTLLYKIDVPKKMIEFAKLHVEAALKGCLNKYHHASEENYDFGSSEIMNSYPLSNIK
jgi:hypothetical protein